MKILLVRIFLIVTLLCPGLMSVAQEIQKLPSDPAVKSGVLPNGMAYYIAVNPSVKGVADFALAVKVGDMTASSLSRGTLEKTSDELLGPQSRLLSPGVRDFFMSRGVVPGKNGFSHVTGNATVYRFENLIYNQSADLLDSTLLVLMGMMEKMQKTEDMLVKGLYSPSDHAIIVAGDVDAAKVTEKLRMLSLMVPYRASAKRNSYVWEESDSVAVRSVIDKSAGLATVKAEWKLQRTPREYMNTVQPVILRKYVNQLGLVAAERIGARLKAAGIPSAGVEYDYVDSMESLGDESFSVSVSVLPADAAKAVEALAAVMSAIDRNEAGQDEVLRAGRLYMDALVSLSGSPVDNEKYVDRCIAAFLYNSPLSSLRNIAMFHNSRDIRPETDLMIFNSIASASVDNRKNLTLSCTCRDALMSETELRETFDSVWMSASSVTSSGDPKPLEVPSYSVPLEKIKVKTVRKEPLSGGKIWTMANGFKVVHKNMKTDDKVHYSLTLNGGYGSIADLRAGEGPCVSDLIGFSRIGGVKGKRFLDVVRQSGMTMNLDVSLSGTVIEGCVDDDRIDYLMKVLLTFFNDRKPDPEEFGYYMKCSPLRVDVAKGRLSDRVNVIDSIMCPGYRYTSCRRSGYLQPDFADKAESFMDVQSSKLNDGVLTLVGDIDEKYLKEVLQTYAGGFRTEQRTFSRAVVNCQPISGTVRYSADGDRSIVDVVMSAQMPLTADNYYAAAIAAMALRVGLTRAVAGEGIYLWLNHSCMRYPQERFNVMISMESTVEALTLVKKLLDDPQTMNITAAELASYKEILKKSVGDRKKMPDYWLKAVSLRYLDGKDFTTGSDARIDAVTVSKVKELLGLLSEGARVEYITNGR